MRRAFNVSRRGIAAGIPLALAAVGLPAAAQDGHPDAALLALQPLWRDANAAYEATFAPYAEAEERAWARLGSEPRRDRGSIERETGFTQASEAQATACYAQWALADRIFKTPSTTTEGIRFKLEVLKAYEGCDMAEHEALLKRDLLRMAGIYDA